MVITMAMTALATVTIAAAGYLIGVRLSRRARARLRDDRERWRAECTRVDAARANALRERDAERARRAALEHQARTNAAYEAGGKAWRQELEALVAPLAERDGAREMETAVRGVLGPFVERERMAQALLRLRPGGGLGDLPAVLDGIARAGGFVSVLLSDESGLPVATSRGVVDLEAASGVFSLLLTMADRLERGGAPVPRSLVVQDEDNQCTVHRIFRVGDERYLLSAVTRRGAPTPDALDPALASLEATLGRRAA
ncbi:MAG TPA: hypothetical protein RMH99_32160 [Sandaracinaceae bacterium LLY-WYZ-13_1]|nr:hypothetical protein [Sandaracinaceae bacterium LLY-WYZ-13_1]